MKNLFFSAIILASVMISCNTKNNETKTKEQTEQSSELYSCPMHPEVTGKKGETCPKCGMELTEPVNK